MATIDDILNDHIFDLPPEQANLFDVPDEMRAVQQRKQADYVAQYHQCEEFEKYKSRFAQVHLELKQGKRALVRITKSRVFEPGSFFVMAGQLLYLESLGKLKKSSNQALNARTRCILENGTETDILLQTLQKNLMADGYAVTETQEETERVFFANKDISDKDSVTGYIYVLRSLSNDSSIKREKKLYKIGFTINSVEERIANAANEPTYLMAPVEIVALYKIVNMHSHIFEGLVHQVLNAAQYHVSITDDKGIEHHPSEWYVVPLEVLNVIIEKICDGTIVNYSYNVEQECLERHITSKRSNFNLSGLKVLRLNISRSLFDAIVGGTQKSIECTLRQNTISRYTYIDDADGKRYLKRFDVVQLNVNRSHNNAIVTVADATFTDGTITYKLGDFIEINQ